MSISGSYKYFEERLRFRLLFGVAILIFPITAMILTYIGIKALVARIWESKHCLTPEQFEKHLAAEGRIALIQN